MPEQPLPPFFSALAAVDPREKRRLAEENRARLEAELWHGSLHFQSRPRIVDVQFSNFCNMACTMCYPHGNPPLQKLPEPVLEKLARDVFPVASVLVPFAGSEPLILTWDLTRRLAQLFGLELDIVTNVQFLDEKKFAELEPLVTSIRFSIDSHLRDVYAAIRLKSKPDQVFANLATAARLCAEHGIEVQTNIVFMAENAAHVDDTIRVLADLGIPTFHLLQYHYSEPAGAASDPYAKHSPAEIDAILARIRAAAAEKRVRVVFDLRTKEVVDHRPGGAHYRDNPKNDAWIEQLRRHFPGYCLQSVNRIKVNADGAVYPCCVADRDQLKLGDLRERDFESIWNGPEARDLRRAMVTQDLPALCRDCSFTSGWVLPPQATLPFVDAFASAQLGVAPGAVAADPTIEPLAPAHVERASAPPTLRWRCAGPSPARWRVALAQGGEPRPSDPDFELAGEARALVLPEGAWRDLRPNMAAWWTVFAVDDAPRRVRRAAAIRCFVRHQPIARVEGSTLYGAAEPIFRFSGGER
ncbi:MAG TPA: radical SAM protein [Planctomycetota bacterium]|nr:radical SAM protein [Planctomycetota bacterium]